jgi:F-type H+-transporting ATPase subunit delta
MALALASRYARALADLVLDPSAGMDPQAAVNELHRFESAFSSAPLLRNVMLSPAVSPARKRAVIARLAEMLGTSRLIRNFLYVVINHRRTSILPEIREALQALLDERLGMVEAGVASARELTEEQRSIVSAQLARLTGKKVRCRFSVKEPLLGGVTARIGSTIYDGSVRGQLARLRQILMD